MDKHVHLRISEEHHKIIEQLAKKRGLTVSAFVRMTLIDEVISKAEGGDSGR